MGRLLLFAGLTCGSVAWAQVQTPIAPAFELAPSNISEVGLSEPDSISEARRQILRKAADNGDVDALIELAAASDSDIDTFTLVRRAAELGDSRGEYQLAAMYASGRGTVKDLDKAVHWGRKAADQGNIEAQFSLGSTLLQSGAENRDEALAFLEKAAARGSSRAARLISAIYAQGAFGVTSDEEKAAAFLVPFAERDDADCQFALASIYRFADRFASQREQADVWLKRAYQNGSQEAATISKEIEAATLNKATP